ncbi:MAG: oligosaccharide flippase family protein [Chloroflexi bacterium]|nr:oligosaccharide flippase family protein [Chloroflexota bacterium]
MLAPRGLLAAAGGVLALNVLLRAVNAAQQAALAAVFGVGPDLDAYATAVSLPNLLTSLLILGPLGLALTPLLAATTSGPARERAWQVASAVLSLVALVSVPLVGRGVLLAPVLVRGLAPGLAPDTADQATGLLRVLLPAVGGAALAAVLRSILHGLRLFAVPLLAYLGSALLLLAATLVLGPVWGTTALAWATLGGAALGLAGQGWVLARRDARLRFLPEARLPELRPLAALLAGTGIALFATHLFWVWDRMVASYLGPGQVALLDFALSAEKLVGGTVALSIATVSYPTLAAAAREGNLALGRAAARMLHLVGVVAVPATVALVVLREPLLRVWLQHGRFGPEAAGIVADLWLFFGPALLSWAFVLPLIMTFHALGRMRLVAGLCLVGLLGNAGAASAGAAWAGLPGLAAGTSVAAALTTAALGLALARRCAGFPSRPVLGALAAVAGAALIAGLLARLALSLLDAAGLPPGWLPDLLRLTSGGAVFGSGFVLLGLLLRVPEAWSLLAALKRTRRPHAVPRR